MIGVGVSDEHSPQPEPDGGVVDAAGGFGIVPVWVVDRLAARPGALALYTLLAARYAGRDRKAWPSRERLATDLSVSVPTIDRGLRALRETKAMDVLKRRSEGGKWDRSVYVLRRDYPDGLGASINVHDRRVTDYPEAPSDLARPAITSDSRSAETITGDSRSLSPVIGRTSTLEPEGAKAPNARGAKKSGDVATVFGSYQRLIQSTAILTDAAAKKITTRLRHYSIEQLNEAITNFSRADWWMERNGGRGAGWFFESDDRIAGFLGLDPERDNASRKSAVQPQASRNGVTEPPSGQLAHFDYNDEPVLRNLVRL